MHQPHDPHAQISNLEQCLSGNKRPLGLFLGAGCPTAVKADGGSGPPLIPDMVGVTKVVRETLGRCKQCGPLLRVIDQHFGNDGRTDANVEDILSHVRALRMVAGKDKVRGLSAANLDKLDERICQVIQEVADKSLPNTQTPYHYIAAWVEAIERDKPVEIFTTNYDLLMEQAFEDCRVPYFDGFPGARKPLFDIRAMEQDVLPPRWARLWKLHGSVNWYQTEAKRVLRSIAKESGLRRVIHPSHLKYEESRRMPYLAMMDRLRAFLKQPAASLVVCGYSFRDEHINEVLVEGLQCTPTAIAFALQFGKIDEYLQAVKLARERPNLTLLAKDAAVITGREAKWPERDADALSADSGNWVTWTPAETEDGNGKRMAEFTLGDFATFGQLLASLSGDMSEPSETSNAK